MVIRPFLHAREKHDDGDEKNPENKDQVCWQDGQAQTQTAEVGREWEGFEERKNHEDGCWWRGVTGRAVFGGPGAAGLGWHGVDRAGRACRPDHR